LEGHRSTSRLLLAALTLHWGIFIRFFTSRMISLVGRASPRIDIYLTGCISLSGVLPYTVHWMLSENRY
jgi:hypothetical protein